METTSPLQPAPVSKRFLAFVVDLALLGGALNVFFIGMLIVLIAVLGLDISNPSPEAIQEQLTGISFSTVILILVGAFTSMLLMASLWHGYFVYFEHRHLATPGKKLMGLKVVSLDGSPLTFKKCVVRELFRSYFDLPFIFPGIVTILCSQKHQRVGDMATDTLVVYSENAEKSFSYLYLSPEQFEEQKKHFKVRDTSLEEAKRYLQNVMPLLLGKLDYESEKQALDFFAQAVTPINSERVEIDEMKLRFLAEYFLQLNVVKS